MKNTIQYNFEGKTALVTGAGSGIGHATAKAFAAAKAFVVLADVKKEEIETVANEINAAGGSALTVTCDVSNDGQVKAMIQKTVSTFGSLDMAFNNAGIISHFTPAIDISSEEWSRIIATNLRGVWNCLKEEVGQMLKQRGGSIVNCSSLAGLVASPGQAAYGATKHGVLGLTKTIGLEYASQGIRINAVCPGTIETPMIPFLVDGDEKVHERFVKSAPIGRLGKPEEIADAVLWLCSSGASYVIGHALAVDGGYVAQ